MNRQNVFSPKRHIDFKSFVFGTMCILTLICIAAVVRNDVFRDSYILLVSVIYILSLIFITILSGFLLSRAEKAVRPMRYFTLFLFNVYIVVFFAAIDNSMYHLPGRAAHITIFETVSFFFGMSLFLTLWLYQKQFLKESAVTRAVTVLISAALVIYAGVLITNLFRPIIFHITDQGVYSEGITDYISIITDFFCLILLCVATFSSNLSRSRKLSFISCIFVPVLFAILSLNQGVLNMNLTIWGIVIGTVMLPLSLIFFNAHDELENDILRREKEQIQLQISAMISQMQPHFLYNSLAVIEALCEEDPKLAAKATSAFSNYLRENIDFADKKNPISFSDELNHIKTYVWLEKLRFPNKLNIEYDIGCTAFPVPALSVQPMVENAIKHGICKKKTGGTVRGCSFETDTFYSVTVSDDGIGFDIRKAIDDDRRHLGINNTQYRIREMVGGSLDIESTPGKGTTVTIKVPK